MKKPTVSQLLDILNKPPLLKWANKIGLDGISLDDFYKTSTRKGISLHKQIEEYIKNNTPMEDPLHHKLLLSFLSDKNVINTEQKVENDMFHGRYDILLEYKNKKYLCDFKSSSGIYFENKLQLFSYSMCIEDEVELAVIEIPSFTFKPIYIDREKYRKMIQLLHSIFIIKQEIC